MKRLLAFVSVGMPLMALSWGNNSNATARDAQEPPRPTAPTPQLEQRILLKADELLKDESVWNRKDDRVCDDDEATGKRTSSIA